ncbi:ribonuclease H-like YkuK family protein [Oceanirhabdus sp. W0125-5]|uniref:ribonuclease H-like YkuK family protein n=1 Tax=Oceanirhabdus sp. W0125-5 TaxID=2999116 RepID=UPI0022F2CEC7|nr:ribonuclease H-like YkuK family protein [Oceanirhabdus sp. W0125-5]WBW95645.1 ribonuclease H-like YkuK family protein [Oceanirhabdus sp. W0125-5]
MKSITYGEIDFKEVCNKIKLYTEKDIQSDYVISVGTDSQSFNGITRMVSVITVIRKTKGGIFFYDITNLKKIYDLRQKLFTETQYSLDLAIKVMEFIKKSKINACLEVHIDIGNDGDTNSLIKEIKGWVVGLGFKFCMKPDSYTSSTIADKISKKQYKVS